MQQEDTAAIFEKPVMHARLKSCEFLNIQRCRRPFNQSTPSQFCVVARTNFAVSVAQTLTVRALILQAIRPCASVWVWLRETNRNTMNQSSFKCLATRATHPLLKLKRSVLLVMYSAYNAVYYYINR